MYIMDYAEAKKLVKSRLSEKRWTHTKNVKKMAVKLARRWGTDPEKAAMAAILHDSAKELPKQELLQIFADNAIIAENAPARPSPVWHGIAGAELLRTKFGVTDEDVLHAVRFHTVGRAGMSNLEKIVYLADMISAERDYPDVDVMREKAAESLNAGMAYALKYSLIKLVRREALIPHHTVEAYNEVLTELQQQEG